MYTRVPDSSEDTAGGAGRRAQRPSMAAGGAAPNGAGADAPGGTSVNYYAVLELEPTATPDEIKRAYRRLALVHHPDKNNGNDEKVRRFRRRRTCLVAPPGSRAAIVSAGRRTIVQRGPGSV